MTPVAVKSLKRVLVGIASAGTIFWAAIPSPDSTEDRQKECFRQRIARLSYTSVEPDMTTIEVRPPEWVDITFKGETARILYLNKESADRAASVGLRMWRDCAYLTRYKLIIRGMKLYNDHGDILTSFYTGSQGQLNSR